MHDALNVDTQTDFQNSDLDTSFQNQNWRYFIERVIKVCKSKEIGSTIKKSEDFLLTTVENVTMAKKSYETFYNIIEGNFYSYVIWQYWIIS